MSIVAGVGMCHVAGVGMCLVAGVGMCHVAGVGMSHVAWASIGKVAGFLDGNGAPGHQGRGQTAGLGLHGVIPRVTPRCDPRYLLYRWTWAPPPGRDSVHCTVCSL